MRDQNWVWGRVLAAASLALVGGGLMGCSADAGGDESVGTTGEALTVGGPDWYKCANEGGTCAPVGPKYMAYGNNGKFFFGPISRQYPNALACNNSIFGDPAPGANKACWFTNLALNANEGGSANVNGEIAYGANGLFTYKKFNGFYTCNTTTFGGDPVPGVNKSCYLALPGYARVAEEGGSFTLSNGNQSVAYGAQGHYVFKVMTGVQLSCGVAFFGSDPAPGFLKSCYVKAHSFGPNEGQTFGPPLPNNWWRFYYGSGLNGAFIERQFPGGGTCNNASFGADPHSGATKHCFGYQSFNGI